jgi:hypothetical protein
VADFIVVVPGVRAGVAGLLPPASDPVVLSRVFTFTEDGVLLFLLKLAEAEAMAAGSCGPFATAVDPWTAGCVRNEWYARVDTFLA